MPWPVMNPPGADSWLSGGKCGRPSLPAVLGLSTEVKSRGWIPALTLDPAVLGGRGSISEKLFRDRALGPT